MYRCDEFEDYATTAKELLEQIKNYYEMSDECVEPEDIGLELVDQEEFIKLPHIWQQVIMHDLRRWMTMRYVRKQPPF